MFLSNVSSKFHNFVGKVSDKKAGMVRNIIGGCLFSVY